MVIALPMGGRQSPPIASKHEQALVGVLQEKGISALGHVDEILATYAGRESSLMSTLEATYTASSSSASGRSPLAPVQTAQATETSQQPQAAHTCNTRAKSWQGTHQDPAVKGRKKSLMTRIWRKTKKTVGR